MRVLLVDDSADNRFVTQAYLSTSGAIIDVAENGLQAVRMVRSSEYDVVLMDIQMPVMDGYTATRMIREWETVNHCKRLPIVVLTAHALQDERQKCAAAGCTALLTKPVRRTELYDVLRAFSKAELLASAPAAAAADAVPAAAGVFMPRTKPRQR
jgi:CheY-like chemotaxis protein